MRSEVDSPNFGTTNSPMKGLERLSEDLKQERQKATSAMQDRARLRIEIENLKGQLQSQSLELSELQSNFHSLQEAKNSLEEKLSGADMTSSNIGSELLEALKNLEMAKLTIERITTERDEKTEQLVSRNEKINLLSQRIDVLEGKIAAKDEFIGQLKEEIGKFKSRQVDHDDKEMQALAQLNDRSREIQELRNRAKQAEAMRESYQQQFAVNKEIKQQLEAALESNGALTQQVRESSARLHEMSIHNDRIEDELSVYHRKSEHWEEEKLKFEQEIDELKRRVAAEVELATIATTRAESATGNKFVLDRQLEELRESHSQLRDKYRDLEGEFAAARSAIFALNSELADAKEKAELVDAALIESNNAQALTIEIEFLRAQLTEVRKQLIRREIDDDAGAMAPQAIIEREAHSRQVYEGVILELRMELDRVNERYHDVCLRMDEAAAAAAKVEKLEEEIEMYREAAKLSAMESQNVAISISEAAERSVRSSHDKSVLLSDIRRVEADLSKAQKEMYRARDELAAERNKLKSIHLEKLSAERKASENLAAKSKLESEMELLKELNSKYSLEVDRLKRQLHDQVSAFDDTKKKLSLAESLKLEVEHTRQQFGSYRAESEARKSELQSELQIAKQSKNLMQQEVESLRSSLSSQRKSLDEAIQECDRLRTEIQQLRDERQRQRRDMALMESNRTEVQLSSLRQDLEKTVGEWRDSELEKTRYQDSLQKMQKELTQEREKASLMKTQIDLLEDRLKLATQELAVFRSLDVYHTSMQSELQSFRLSKSAEEKGTESLGARRESSAAFASGTYLANDDDARSVDSQGHSMEKRFSLHDISTNNEGSVALRRRSTGVTRFVGSRSTSSFVEPERSQFPFDDEAARLESRRIRAAREKEKLRLARLETQSASNRRNSQIIAPSVENSRSRPTTASATSNASATDKFLSSSQRTSAKSLLRSDFERARQLLSRSSQK